MLLPTHISSFARKDRVNQLIEPQPHEISCLDIHQFLSAHPDLVGQLLPHAALSNIVHIARSNPQGFTAYCTISNTVKAIGIGGTASIYFSAKVTPFLTQSREAMARNIVDLTRSKGLCVLLLPSTQEFRFSFLHTLRTLCAYRHGLYHIGSAPPDLPRLATFLSLPDATTWEAEAWIMWSSVGGRVEAGGLRVLEFRIQGCSEVEGGGGRRARR